jgi:superoxide reductase
MEPMEIGVFYRCQICGNLVALIHEGGGELVCCGQPMTRLVANAADASKEKHVPVVVKGNGTVDVTVGSVAHPMTAEHFIEWIALVNDKRIELVYLKPGMQPDARFLSSPVSEKVNVVHVAEGERDVPNCEGSPCNFSTREPANDGTTIFAYCNLHGLWKA